MYVLPRCAAALVAAMVVSFWSASVHAIVTRYAGVPGTPASIDPGFATATSGHAKELIDFDDDGFVLEPHQFTPIEPGHYAPLGVKLLNLDARSVGTQQWSHSPPMAAWHTGFSLPITTPYSFLFDAPVASFGLFLNDLEGPLTVTVHTTIGTDQFLIPSQGGAEIGQFHGFTAPQNLILRLDFLSSDYHILDDVQFGYVPEPASALLTIGTAIGGRRRRVA